MALQRGENGAGPPPPSLVQVLPLPYDWDDLVLQEETRTLLREVSFLIRQGERVALLGENGSGKSTLLKTIMGQIPALSGSFRVGANVRIGYLAQEQDTLDQNSTALQSLQSVAPMNETDARHFLHFYLFADDQPLVPIRSLSYGERARARVCRSHPAKAECCRWRERECSADRGR